MKLEEGLEKRKEELNGLENEIKRLAKDAEGMKETVKNYNEIKKHESELKKLKRQKERDLNIVLSFFKDTDDHYLDKVFPLFKDHQEERTTIANA